MEKSCIHQLIMSVINSQKLTVDRYVVVKKLWNAVLTLADDFAETAVQGKRSLIHIMSKTFQKEEEHFWGRRGSWGKPHRLDRRFPRLDGCLERVDRYSHVQLTLTYFCFIVIQFVFPFL